MAERKRVCCNCGNNIREGEIGNVKCYCAIDGHDIGYIACFEHWCRGWKKEREWEGLTMGVRYFYESHMGGIYSNDKYCDDLYCEQCGDSDTFIGSAADPKEALELLRDWNEKYKFYSKDYIDKIVKFGWEG